MNDALKHTLEALVDKYGLRMVAENLVEVCHDKVEHLATNWQDTQSAKVWNRIACELGNAVHWNGTQPRADEEWPS